jgi:hypothetical protein
MDAPTGTPRRTPSPGARRLTALHPLRRVLACALPHADAPDTLGLGGSGAALRGPGGGAWGPGSEGRRQRAWARAATPALKFDRRPRARAERNTMEDALTPGGSGGGGSGVGGQQPGEPTAAAAAPAPGAPPRLPRSGDGSGAGPGGEAAPPGESGGAEAGGGGRGRRGRPGMAAAAAGARGPLSALPDFDFAAAERCGGAAGPCPQDCPTPHLPGGSLSSGGGAGVGSAQWRGLQAAERSAPTAPRGGDGEGNMAAALRSAAAGVKLLADGSPPALRATWAWATAPPADAGAGGGRGPGAPSGDGGGGSVYNCSCVGDGQLALNEGGAAATSEAAWAAAVGRPRRAISHSRQPSGDLSALAAAALAGPPAPGASAAPLPPTAGSRVDGSRRTSTHSRHVSMDGWGAPFSDTDLLLGPPRPGLGCGDAGSDGGSDADSSDGRASLPLPGLERGMPWRGSSVPAGALADGACAAGRPVAAAEAGERVALEPSFGQLGSGGASGSPQSSSGCNGSVAEAFAAAAQAGLGPLQQAGEAAAAGAHHAGLLDSGPEEHGTLVELPPELQASFARLASSGVLGTPERRRSVELAVLCAAPTGAAAAVADGGGDAGGDAGGAAPIVAGEAGSASGVSEYATPAGGSAAGALPGDEAGSGSADGEFHEIFIAPLAPSGDGLADAEPCWACGSTNCGTDSPMHGVEAAGASSPFSVIMCPMFEAREEFFSAEGGGREDRCSVEGGAREVFFSAEGGGAASGGGSGSGSSSGAGGGGPAGLPAVQVLAQGPGWLLEAEAAEVHNGAPCVCIQLPDVAALRALADGLRARLRERDGAAPRGAASPMRALLAEMEAWRAEDAAAAAGTAGGAALAAATDSAGQAPHGWAREERAALPQPAVCAPQPAGPTMRQLLSCLESHTAAVAAASGRPLAPGVALVSALVAARLNAGKPLPSPGAFAVHVDCCGGGSGRARA